MSETPALEGGIKDIKAAMGIRPRVAPPQQGLPATPPAQGAAPATPPVSAPPPAPVNPPVAPSAPAPDPQGADFLVIPPMEEPTPTPPAAVPGAAAPSAPAAPPATPAPSAPEEPQIDQHAPPGLRAAFDKQKEFWRNKIKPLEEEIAKLKSAPPTQVKTEIPPEIKEQLTQLESLKQRAEQAEKELAKLDIQYDPQFRATFQLPMMEKEQTAKSVLTSYGVDASQVAVLKSLSGKDRAAKVMELTKDLGAMAPMAAAEIMLPFRAMDEINGRMHAALQDAENVKKQLEQTRMQQVTQLRSQTKETALRFLQEQGNMLYNKIVPNGKLPQDKVAAWNAQAESLHRELDEVLTRGDALKQTALIAEGLAAPKIRQSYQRLMKDYTELKKTVAAMQSAVPGGRSPAPDGNPVQPGTTPPSKLNAESLFKMVHAQSVQELGAAGMGL